MNLHDNVFGINIRAIRLERGLTQAAVGKKIGIDNTEVSKLENGKMLPSERMLAGFAKALGVSEQTLITRKPPPVPVDVPGAVKRREAPKPTLVPAPPPLPAAAPPAAAAPEPKPEPPPPAPPEPKRSPVEAFKAAAKAAVEAGTFVPPPDFEGFDRLPGFYHRADTLRLATEPGDGIFAFMFVQVGRLGDEPLFSVYRSTTAPALRGR